MIEPYLGTFPTIDPTAFVHERATVIGDVTIGPECAILPGAVLRGDVGRIVIGARTSIQDNAMAHTTGGVSETIIGDGVTVGHGAILHGCQVGNDCIVGMGAIVMDNAIIEPWTIVGAGALVPPRKTYPTGHLVLGRPAKAVRPLAGKDREWITYSAGVYVGLAADYRG